MTMSNDSQDDDRPPKDRKPAAAIVEMFCIHSYAGQWGPPCGWRGSSEDVFRSSARSVNRCPRCGRATLLEIPASE
jgi:hypothetical protein